MRIIFIGSSEFACPALETLIKAGHYEIVGVVTQPERPSGRHRQMKKCPVDAYASAHGLNVLAPENINSPESITALKKLNAQLILVAAYGQIFKSDILALPEKGCLNLHGSLLPQYRGAAPIQWAIARGERKTGVTTMFMNEKMDAGDIIAQAEEEIRAGDTAATLGARLGARGAELLLKTIELIFRGNPPRQKQNEALSTYAPMLKKSDGLLDWKMPARDLESRIRAFQPWPVCFFVLDNTRIRVLRARVELDGGYEAGTVLEARGEGPLIQCGKSSLRLLELQPEGKKPMSGNAFLCGNKISSGNLLP